MKRYAISCLLLLLAVCLTGCAQDTPAAPAAGTLPPGQAVVTCRVAAVTDDQLLLAKVDGTENDVYALSLGQTPVTYQNPDQTAIRPGDVVQVGYSGAIQETYPAQLGDVAGIVVEQKGFDNLCSLYLQVLDDLWRTDDALNEGVLQLGLDLSQTRLPPAEQGAVAVAFGQARNLPVVQGTWQELSDQGYFGQENLEWDQGLFFSIEEDPGAQDLSFTAQKWRGGLAAYFFTGCTAKQSADGTWPNYTVGGHAIS